MTGSTRVRTLVAGLAASALVLTGGGGAAAAPGDSIALGVAPQVPGRDDSFQVRATGTATDGSGSIYVSVLLAPGAPACPPTADLAEATFYDQEGDDRWGFWLENWIDETYDVAEVFAGRPTGRYRLCGYLHDTFRDPMATTVVDFTIGGTCASAAAQVTAKEKSVAKKLKTLKRAKRALRSAKASDQPRRVVKRAAKKVHQGKHRVVKAKRQLRGAKAAHRALC
ncbi:hypothetical protein [Nocardioides sp. YIM 152315]|uniref:hypothetical protein n=1 Tax=Nocardioides sp. YIM 152315 TaxID=3031760 RepID=UPI0023DAA3EA|nr:hypothetical protein [Nocardioides sp. YIM 152315]MDF1602536.1 hypothetical protein [Nocardioides sp. YIM 152315]